MDDRTVMQRLIWKDIETVKPLVIAAAIGMVLSNLLLASLWHFIPPVSPRAKSVFIGWCVGLWVMFPHLVAFGAPAMLVGTEEESGTLGWLRTLPVRWQQVAGAKLCVAVGALIVTWAIAFIILWLTSFGWKPSTFASPDDLVSFRGALLLVFYSLGMLLLGFTMMYLFRSPMLGLSIEAPLLMLMLVIFTNVVIEVDWLRAEAIPAAGIYTGVTTLLLLWVMQRMLARRRLVSPEQSLMASTETASTPGQIPASLLRVHSQPSQIVSLLWQQLRQTGPLCVSLLALTAFVTLLSSIADYGNRQFAVLSVLGLLSPLLVTLSASWFGAMVFYGDNVHRRCGFFADRGISPTRVWWTRVAPPAASCLLLLVLIVGIGFLDRNENWSPLLGSPLYLIAIVTVLFAFGQLVSQWMERPILAFFAAPAYAFVSLIPVIYLLERFNGDLSDFAAILLAVPVLLLATWRLTRPWLDGRIHSGYTFRVLGYTAVAVLLPCLWIIGSNLLFGLISLPALAGVTP